MNSNFQPTRPQARPRSKSGFSLRSDKSNNSNKAHKRKESLVESASEKRKTHMSAKSKANPNAAMNEAQPIALALEKATIANLHNIKCNDIYGNVISDPDKSNPTRWRMERPLETIRSFETAIDRGYRQRQSTYSQPPMTAGWQSQRSSTYMGNGANGGYESQGRLSQYAGGGNGMHGASHDSFGENGHSHPHPMRLPRNQSEPIMNRYPAPSNVYTAVGDSRSRDTLNTGASSGSEHWKESTAPTSDEGSLERQNGMSRPDARDMHPGFENAYAGNYSDDERGIPQRGYGTRGPPPVAYNNHQRNFAGAGGGYHTEQQNGSGYYPPSQPGAQGSQMEVSRVPVPAPPPKDGPVPQPPPPPTKNIIKLDAPVPNGAVQPLSPKRSSWLKRHFSRDSKG